METARCCRLQRQEGLSLAHLTLLLVLTPLQERRGCCRSGYRLLFVLFKVSEVVEARVGMAP